MARETVRVLYHLNGVTKLACERMYTLDDKGHGPVVDVATSQIPEALRQIGTRFVAEIVDDVLTVVSLAPAPAIAS